MKINIKSLRMRKEGLSSSNRISKKETNFEDYICKVEKKAYELYEKRGRAQGSDWEDWFQAEKIVEDEFCSKD